MPNLAFYSFQEYRNKAFQMASNLEDLKQHKARLKSNLEDKFWPHLPEMQTKAFISLLANL
jgi:hypothetical protein